MSVVSVCLSVVGIATNTISIATELLSGSEKLNEEELFTDCFARAVNRRSNNLKEYTEKGEDERNVYVERESVKSIIKNIDNIDVQNIDSDRIVTILVGKLEDTFVVRGDPIPKEEKGRFLKDSVEKAAKEFVYQLPIEDAYYFRAKVISEIDKDDKDDEIKGAIKNIKEEIKRLKKEEPYLDPSQIEGESQRSGERNPFLNLKTEDFNNPAKIANLFREPQNYSDIAGYDNLVIEGGRGCGKSMVLKSMDANVALRIESINRSKNIDTYEGSSLEYFGVYIKLTSGCFDECSVDSELNENQATVLFQHYFNMSLLECTLIKIKEAQGRSILTVSREMETRCSKRIAGMMGLEKNVDSFNKLIGYANRQHDDVLSFINDKKLGMSGQYSGNYTDITEFPRKMCSILTDHVDGLKGKRIYFLLDEFENLLEYQQRVVNTLVSQRPKSLNIKISTRPLGVKAKKDLQGEPIQYPRDYKLISLDYDPKSDEYRELLKDISNSRLETAGIDKEITEILSEYESDFPSVQGGFDRLKDEIIDHVENSLDKKWENLEDGKKSNYINHLKYAFVFRVNKLSEKHKYYAGVDDLAFLSSGIISNFLEICKVAYFLAKKSGIKVSNCDTIKPTLQNDAVYTVSSNKLDRISRNIPDTGAELSGLIDELGALLREKLLNHNSEPEAARIHIQTGQKAPSEYSKITSIINSAVKWSILQKKEPSESYVSKHRVDANPEEYIFNRILLPVLGLSPRARWQTSFTLDELQRLAHPRTKSDTKKSLMSRMHGSGGASESSMNLFSQ